MPRPSPSKSQWSGRTSAAPAKRNTTPKKSSPKSIKKTFTKSEMISCLAENNEITRKQAEGVLEDLKELIGQHLKNGLPFVISGLCKFKPVRKPATKARKSVNPFTGEPMTIKAKPARNAVKILALKDLKECVQ